MRRIVILLALIILMGASLIGQVPSRPFIVITSSEYSAQQAKASAFPWANMKAKAIDTANNEVYVDDDNVRTEGAQAQKIISALALSYILDPDNRATYVDRFETDGAAMMADLKAEKDLVLDVLNNEYGDVGYNSILGGAVFVAYIALDIMYNDVNFDGTARSAIEADCDYLVVNHHPTSWIESTYSLRALKELYHNGKTAIFETNMDSYKNAILHETTSDGVFCPGPGYTFARLWADERPQKKLFMDLCEYQGYNEFYSNQVFIDMHEWVTGYSRSTVKRSYSFSDADPSSYIGWTAATLRVFRFSENAMKYLIFNQSQAYDTDSDVEGRLFEYLLTETVDGTPKQPADFTAPTYGPPDRIFDNGGAFFRTENKVFKWKTEAVGGAMWNVNPSEAVAHQHNDVNAIHITGYGENILRNSGYNGWKEPDNGGTIWDWIHNTSRSSNTAIINDTDHAGKEGGGIAENIINDKFSFASGYSGDALGNGYHQRNFLLVKPQTGINPYFVVFDEVTVNTAGHTVQAFWHPTTITDPIITNTDELFDFNALKANIEGNDVDVSILLVNEPTSVSMNDGYFGAATAPFRYTGRYLEANYSSTNSFASFATVIYPEYSTLVANSITRHTGSNFYAGVVAHSASISDYAISSDGSIDILYDDIAFIGLSTLYRLSSGTLDFVFSRKGTKFIDSQTNNYGFESDDPVTIFMLGDTGTVITPATDVKFYQDGVQGVLINDVPKTLTASGTGWVTVTLTAGTYHFELTNTDQSLPIRMTSFTASRAEQSVLLKWKTEAEIDNMGFDVERSTESDTWTKLGFESGAGSSNEAKEYEFLDQQPVSGNILYRLKQVDLSGEYEYSNVVSIYYDMNLPQSYSLEQNYPNPFNPVTHIAYTIPVASDVLLTIFDVSGRKVSELELTNQKPGYYSVDWDAVDDEGNSVESGVYFFTVHASEYSETIKMIYLK